MPKLYTTSVFSCFSIILRFFTSSYIQGRTFWETCQILKGDGERGTKEIILIFEKSINDLNNYLSDLSGGSGFGVQIGLMALVNYL